MRATAAQPGPSSHFLTYFASRVRFAVWVLEKEFLDIMPTLKDVTVSVPSAEASAELEAPGEDIEGTRGRIRGAPSCAIRALS